MGHRAASQAAIAIFIVVLAACDAPDSSLRNADRASPVVTIQDEIAAADFTAEAYYASTYRYAEPKYWLRIAGWITENALERQFVEQKPVTTVLDLGCGYGTLLAFATTSYAARGICFDVVPYIQPAVQTRFGIEYREIDIEKDPFPASLQVDVVLMTEVIEHLNFHPKTTLSKIFAVLKPGGSFFVSTPDADKGWGRVYDYYDSIDSMPLPDPDAQWIDGHIWQYTELEIRAVLEDAGFVIKRMEHAPGVVGLHFNVWAVKPVN